MSAPTKAAAAFGSAPDLCFRVEDAGVLELAAAPTLGFRLRIECVGGAQVRALQLNVQLRIVAPQRPYDAQTQARLLDLFGEPGRWGNTLQSLFWAQATLTVPAFVGETQVELPVPCTYDFEVASAKYFHSVESGEIPLEFLFGGTVFYADEAGALQVGRVGWEKEARYRLPAGLWKELMAAYFPDSAWLRVRRDTFDRLYEYRARRALPTWEAALDQLLGGGAWT